ncbi:MAG: GntP family permease [Candidatus Hydrogenedentes bacterium]|nr:GntP family permease [Candidatus Hydrogenedentota bacterium]
MGTLGVLAGLALLIFFALRGVNILIASLICSGVVAVSNGMPWAEALAVDYTKTMMGFAGNFFILLLTGAIFGRVMSESGAAQSVAAALRNRLGDQHALLIIVLATAGLTYGGVNVFIVVFTLYPLAVGLVHRANLPKRLLTAAAALGSGTFTMTALPASPSIHNNIAAKALGTPLTAGVVLGLAATVVMFGLGMLYLNWQTRVARQRGERFIAGPMDAVQEEQGEKLRAPGWLVSCVPLTLVVLSIMLPRFFVRFVPDLKATTNSFEHFIAFTVQQPIMWTALALVVGILAGMFLFRAFLPDLKGMLGRGAENSALPLLYTAAVIGFGGVVSKTPIFESFATFFMNSSLPPLASVAISINVIAGITGSASGGLQIWMSSFAQHYLDSGIAPETLHRVVTVASGALDSLPHCGAIVTFLTVTGVTHREGYRDIGVVTVLIPGIATVVVVILGMILG